MLISGEKQWISNGHYSDFNITVARESDDGAAGIGLYVVDRAQGYESRNIPKLALNRQSTAQLFFDDVRIPRSQVLFPAGEGLKRLMTLLEGSRPLVGLMAVGIAQAALEYSIDYAKDREQHGKPIAAHQLIQARVAEMAVKIEASRLMLYKALDQVGRGLRSDLQSGMAKYFATESAIEVTRHAMAIHGGNGVTREFPIEELYRMAPILTVDRRNTGNAKADHPAAACSACRLSKRSVIHVCKCHDALLPCRGDAMSIAIVGIAELPTRRDPERTRWDDAPWTSVVGAVQDAGIDKNDIEAVISVNPMAQAQMALDMALGRIPEFLGMDGCKDICVLNSWRHVDNELPAPRQVLHRQQAGTIRTRAPCHHSVRYPTRRPDQLLCYGTSRCTVGVSVRRYVQTAAMGLITNRYMHETGATPEQLASGDIGATRMGRTRPQFDFLWQAGQRRRGSRVENGQHAAAFQGM